MQYITYELEQVLASTNQLPLQVLITTSQKILPTMVKGKIINDSNDRQKEEEMPKQVMWKERSQET